MKMVASDFKMYERVLVEKDSGTTEWCKFCLGREDVECESHVLVGYEQASLIAKITDVANILHKATGLDCSGTLLGTKAFIINENGDAFEVELEGSIVDILFQLTKIVKRF